MIISPGRRYVFVHIPKTGGTALSVALEARAMKEDILSGDTPKAQARRFAIYGTITFLVLLFLVPLFGTTVNGARIQQHGPIAPTDQIVVGPFTLVIEDRIQAQGTSAEAPAGAADAAMSAGATGASQPSALAPMAHQGHPSHTPHAARRRIRGARLRRR